MGDARIGNASYIRTLKHRKLMSVVVNQRDLTAQSKRFVELNKQKKGKTIEELYGDKAIHIRNLRKLQVGERNPNWKGGKHRNRYPYRYYKLRIQVLERDLYICQNCFMTDNKARELDSLNRGLTIHHIDYNKENNSLDNLITTCKWCNSRANSEREKWQNHYRQLLLGV